MEIRLKHLVPSHRPVLFICVGTDRSTGDSLGPIVGSRLKALGYDVLGTIHEPVHAMNIPAVLEVVKHHFPNHFVVGIDAALGRLPRVGKVGVSSNPLRPGAGVNKQLPKVGDVSIHGVVNVSGFMEYYVLQNTRLSVVLDLADEIVAQCIEAVNTEPRIVDKIVQYPLWA
jgi:putative sporulation protein YyaC